MKKIEKFNYQLIPSSHKGFKEVLVTFEYKGKTCHYYSFIKEDAKLSSKQYIAEAKKEVTELARTGKIYKYAKKYLHYPVQEEENVKPITIVKKVPVRVKKGYPPFLAMWICGLVSLVISLDFLTYNLLNEWPAIRRVPADVQYRIDLFNYLSIGFGVLAIVLLAIGVPLFIVKLRKYKKSCFLATAPKAKKK